jgi:hypothetical protein
MLLKLMSWAMRFAEAGADRREWTNAEWLEDAAGTAERQRARKAARMARRRARLRAAGLVNLGRERADG